MKVRTKKIIAGVLLAATFAGSAFAVGRMIFYKGTLTHQLEVQEKRAVSQGMTVATANDATKDIIMQNIHMMANTKIIAEDGQIWGRQNMTNDEIDTCINYVGVNDIRSDINVEELIKYLNEWKNGDYSHAVELHNITWDYLGGTVGRAVKLR